MRPKHIKSEAQLQARASQITHHHGHLEGLLRYRWLGSPSGGPKWSWRCFISNKFPADTAGLGPRFGTFCGKRWRRHWHPTPLLYSCLKDPTGGGAWWAAVHGVAKSQAQLSDFPFTFHFPALEKEMATHSSVLAWRIPGRGEPGGLPSRGSQSRTQLKRLKQQQREGNRAQRCCSRLLGRSSQRIRTHTWQV